MISIGIGEYAVTDIKGESIVTHSLGSCVALIMHCPLTKCTAMAHVVLPEQDRNNRRFMEKEAYFAADIVPKLIRYFTNRPYCSKNDLKVYLVGGAESGNTNDYFKIGERNVNKITGILDAYGLKYDCSEVLGRYSRTVEIYVDKGEVLIKKREMRIYI